jgi:acyl dehydratase
MTQPLYLEDLHIGDRFNSGTYTLTAEKLHEFASEYDPQPFHLDPELAKDTLFKSIDSGGFGCRRSGR